MSGVNDYAKYEALSKNAIQMAMKILELEASFKHYRIHVDPNRRAGLIARLEAAIENSQHDPEEGHSEADDILLEFIDDPEISKLFGEVRKYYS